MLQIIFKKYLNRFLLIFFISSSANASVKISQQDVINSAIRHYPTILSFYEKVDAAHGSFLATEGFFDVKIKQNYEDKTRGFYNGKVSDTSLEKQNQFLGSKLYGGYRKSYGDFPDYEGDSLTNHDGEVRAGIKFSLLRNSGIDQNRLGMLLAGLGIEESKIQLENIKIEIQRDAIKAYWNWVASGKVYKIYQDLFDLALKRQNQLEIRLKKGDIAQIIVAENQKNILRRKTALAEAKRDFENAAIYLSLFLRNDKGEPLIPKEDQLSEVKFHLEDIKAEKLNLDIDHAINNRAETRIIKLKKRQELAHLNYSENLFKPKFDVDAGVSKDLGNGPESRSQTNNFIKLEFEMPLQQREAKGKIAAARSKINSINYEEQLIQEQIKTELMRLKTSIHNMNEIFNNLKDEAILAETLEKAELEKFNHGASNFFLVNLREQDTASARAAKISAFKKYQEAFADYKAAVFSFE